MSDSMISAVVFLVAVVLCVLVLRSCESPPEPQTGPIQYPNYEETTELVTEVQYPNETTKLPPTGGVPLI